MVSLVQVTLTDLMAEKIKRAYADENSDMISQLKSMVSQCMLGEHQTFNYAATEKIRQLGELCGLLKFGRTIMVDLRTANLIDEILNNDRSKESSW